ncbi:AAA family ATPase [Pseudomonas putida]|uniref:AAA family ATPase n=1 Tax=Pseudomonas putida TaxID=303 RepID=UPI001EF80928|nr:AAA family ATPase [Pseudomonas putida]ULL06143.1 AAA family ATPase [Pseudomonas putida]
MHISSVSVFNIFGSTETRTIDLDAPVVILTGYNGAGKSTLLGVLHSTLSVSNGQEYLFPKSDWGCSVKFSNDTEVVHVKTARVLPDNFSPPSIRKNKNADYLKSYYEAIQEITVDRGDKRGVIVRREGEGRNALSTNVVSIRPGKGGVRASSVLYGDEIFSSKQDDLESKKFEDLDIFSKKKNLDKTFFLLQTEFSAQAKVSDGSGMTAELMDVIDKALTVLGHLKKNEANELRVQVDALEKIREKKFVSNPFLKEANVFFATTNRELRLGANGFLFMKTSHGDVNWYDFSKGEKTLLCLLLVAYLTGDKEMVFLLDEPDLSLHIKWQRQLLTSMRALAPNSQYIVATHSPALVGRTEGEAVINVGAISKG